MNIRHRISAPFALAIFACWFVAPAWAKDPPDKSEKAAVVEKEAAPTSREVTAILETKPTTPSECLGAAKVLVDLDRPDLAKASFEKSARRQAATSSNSSS